MDMMLDQGRLEEYIFTIADIKSDEQILDVWLHKVYDKPFSEFRESVKSKQNKKDDPKVVKKTLTDSMDILNNFNPRM